MEPSSPATMQLFLQVTSKLKSSDLCFHFVTLLRNIIQSCFFSKSSMKHFIIVRLMIKKCLLLSLLRGLLLT